MGNGKEEAPLIDSLGGSGTLLGFRSKKHMGAEAQQGCH